MVYLYECANDHLKVSLREDCSGVIVDKASDTQWHISPVALQDREAIMDEMVWTRSERSFCVSYPGRFQAERQGDAARAIVRDDLGRQRGTFTFRVTLDGPWVVFTLLEIDEALPSLVFPPHIESASLVLPTGVGKWVRQPGYRCQFMTQATHLVMRWFGGLEADEEHGWIGLFEDGYADSGLYAKGLAAAPAWLKSHQRWTAPRSIRYRCTTGGYVGQAKVFREYAKAHDMFRGLDEKIAEVPAADCLRGGRIMSFFQAYTRHPHRPLEMLHPMPHGAPDEPEKVIVEISHADVAAIMAEAKQLGMTRGVFNLRGTFRGGYDEYHPDIWPPEPALGTLDELKALIASDGDHITLLHDNYQDIYPRAESFPTGVVRMSNGELMPGGFWHGGQCYIMNPRMALANVKRNWEHLATLEPKGVFCDTMACVQFYEDYHPDHPLTRTGDFTAKIDMMRFYKSKGLVLGSENASDFGMSHIDFLENRHAHVPGESIPLWPLVYHDAAYCGRYPQGGTSSTEAAGDLADVLWGYALIWSVGSRAIWQANRDRFVESLAIDRWHERIGTAEMVTHRYLGDDRLVEQTEFANGLSVLANFADEPRTIEGKTVPAGGHVVLD